MATRRLAAQVADWLTQVRGAAGVEEIRLGPLSRAELAGQVAALAGGPVPPRVVDELYARAEGNPFFTEQLVAATLADASEGGLLRAPAGLPARLAELLAARAGRCAGNARAVLAGLAVAGRPLAEDPLAAVTGLDAEAVRGGLRELAAARLLAEDTSGGEYRPRHALLAEAVAAGLLPGERAALHGSMARALAATGDDRAPRRWPGTGRPPGIRPPNCPPGWRPPRPPSGYSATPKPRRTGNGPSSWARHCPAPPTRAASACRGCMSGPSTRSTGRAPECAPRGSPRRPSGGSPVTPTRRPPRPSATAPGVGGRPARPTLGSP